MRAVESLTAEAPVPTDKSAPAVRAIPGEGTGPKLAILFGSQTGTAETLAHRAAKEAQRRGFAATVLDMGCVTVEQLAAESHVLVVTSTYGDGEPPDNALPLHAALARDPAGPLLARVQYTVCGLGEEKYAEFCKCGRDFDQFLERWGASRMSARADCNLDYDDTFDAWLEAALGAIAGRAELSIATLAT